MVAALPTGPEHAALIAACQTLADQLDAAEAFDDKLWREYRLALKALMERAAGGTEDDDFDAEFDSLRTEVGNTAES